MNKKDYQFEQQFDYLNYSTVNKKYIQDYIIKDDKGNKIDFYKNSSNYLLIPKSLNSKQLQKEIALVINSTYEIIIIEDGITLKTLSPDSFPYSSTNEIIYVIDKLDEKIQLNYPNLIFEFKGMKSYKTFVNGLDKLMIKDNIVLMKNEQRYNVNYDILKSRITIFILLLLIDIIIILFYINLSVSIYINEFGEVLIIRYLLGHSHLQRYELLYALSIISYIITGFLSVYIFNNDLLEIAVMLFMLFIIDTLIQYVNINVLQKRSIYK